MTKALVEELAYATEMPNGFSSAFSVYFLTTLENLVLQGNHLNVSARPYLWHWVICRLKTYGR